MTARSDVIDATDLGIIGLLLENSRSNFVKIGKELEISKNTAWNRYNQMIKKGAITGATIQVNYKKLGYDAVGTLLMDVDPSKIEQVVKHIKSTMPDAFGPFLSASTYNLRTVVTLKTISELGKIKEELSRSIAINEISSSIWTDVWFTPENLTLIPTRLIEPLKETANDMFDADEVDLQMIRLLAEDSRTCFRSIAKHLGISIDTVARRFEKLKKENIIVPRLQIDLEKIGYHAMANFYFRVKAQSDIDIFVSKILQTPDIFYTMKCRGDYNVGAILMVKSIQDLLETGDYITRLDHVKRIATVVNAVPKKWPEARTYTSTLNKNLIFN